MAAPALVLLAGETAIVDRHDIAPRALERAGGAVVAFGAPVDPGNLLLLGRLGAVPVVGAPGCARSPRDNVVDAVLPRLLAGDVLTRADVVALGHGGLLEDVPERGAPRTVTKRTRSPEGPPELVEAGRAARHPSPLRPRRRECRGSRFNWPEKKAAPTNRSGFAGEMAGRV